MSLYLLLQNLRWVFWSEGLMMRSERVRFIHLPRTIHQHQWLCLGSWWPGAESNQVKGRLLLTEKFAIIALLTLRTKLAVLP
jgi:hypothetical protein